MNQIMQNAFSQGAYHQTPLNTVGVIAVNSLNEHSDERMPHVGRRERRRSRSNRH